MPVMTIKADPHGPDRQERLMRKTSVKVNDLTDAGGRVLVVYGDDGASIYYEEPAREADAEPKAS